MLTNKLLPKYFQLSIIIFVLFSLISCDDEWRRPRNLSNWESTDPLSIPFRTRYQKYLAGNLVPNHSFEKGRLSSENEKQQYITRWDINGSTILYIQNDSIIAYTNFDNRCVLIENNIYDETSESEQFILSDFIDVIPGAYDLSLMIKLENIKPYNTRISNTLNDAINIQLLFFDNNKKEISSRISFYESGDYYDASNRSLVFSSFTEIKELEWSNIFAESFDNELLDGFIPSETKYVRIKIGLKGTGRMWIDEVNFKYSKRNFSFKEKIDFSKDSICENKNKFIPSPKFVGLSKSIELVFAQESEILYPIIINAFDNSDNTKLIINNFKKNASYIIREIYPDSEISIINSNENFKLKNSSIIFKFRKIDKTKDQEIFDIYPEIELKKDAYFIYENSENSTKTIEIVAHNIYGLHYASNTLLKMFDNLNCLLNFSSIYDFPDVDFRGILFNYDNKTNTYDDISFLSNLNFNAIFFPKYNTIDEKQFVINSNKTIDLMTHFPQLIKGELISYNEFELYNQNDQKNNNPIVFEHKLFSNSNDYYKQKDELLKKLIYKSQAKDEAKIVIDGKSDKNQNSNKTPDKKVLNIIYQNSQRIGINFFTQQVQIYLNSILRTSDTASNQKLTIYDNSYFKFPFYCKEFNPNYTNIVKTLSLFEPYQFRNNITNTKDLDFIFKIDSINEIQKIKLQILSEFLWNAETYSPEFTACKVLLNNYGAETMSKLILFNDMYVKSLSYLSKLKLQNKMDRNSLRNFEIAIVKLEKILEEIESSKERNSEKISYELRNFTEKLKTEFDLFKEVQNEKSKLSSNTIDSVSQENAN